MSADTFAVVFKHDDVWQIAVLQDSSYPSKKDITLEDCLEHLLKVEEREFFFTEDEATDYYYFHQDYLAELGIMLTEYGICATLEF